MRIGIISDTHGSKSSLNMIHNAFKNVDFFIHAGDHWQDGYYLQKKYKVPVIAVKGNCDLNTFPYEIVFELKNKRFYVTHGHRYRVKDGLQCLYYRAQECKADYCIFGHTHEPQIASVKNITFLNPGSLTWPRGEKKYLGIVLEYWDNNFHPRLLGI